MSLDSGVAATIIADLQGRLDAVADPGTKEVVRRHTRYLPGHEGYKARKRGGGRQSGVITL